MKSNAVLTDNKVLNSIRADGDYTNAGFFLNVLKMTMEIVFIEPAFIDQLIKRIKL